MPEPKESGTVGGIRERLMAVKSWGWDCIIISRLQLWPIHKMVSLTGRVREAYLKKIANKRRKNVRFSNITGAGPGDGVVDLKGKRRLLRSRCLGSLTPGLVNHILSSI